MTGAFVKLVSRFGSAGGRVRRGGWAIADQVSVGGTSFLTTILVGRSAGAAELGLYSLGFVILMALISAQESVLTVPYTILQPRHHGGKHRRYAGVSLAQYGLQALLFAAGLAVAAFLAGLTPAGRMAPILWALSLAIPMRLLLEFVRRVNYTELRLREAFQVDCLANVGQIALMLLLLQWHALTAASAFAAMGASCGISATLWLAPRMKLFPLAKSMWGWWSKNWQIGRWLLARQATSFVGMGSLPYMIYQLVGDAETGKFAACLMLENLANPIIVAISNLQTPLASRALASEGVDAMRKIIRQSALLLGGIAVALCLGLVLLGDPLMQMFYGSEFAGIGAMVSVLGVKALFQVPGQAPACGLIVMKRTRLSFQFQVLGLTTTVTSALILMPRFGVIGAAYAMLLGAIATASATTWGYFAATKEEARQASRVAETPVAVLSDQGDLSEKVDVQSEGVVG